MDFRLRTAHRLIACIMSPLTKTKHPLRVHRAPRAHLVGIGGAGMRSLADVLFAAGWQISGSDLLVESLVNSTFNVSRGHDPRHVDANLDLRVHTDSASHANPR